ncbi:oligoendopeptidase F [Ammoniphilus sp. CFH 90114]|uniref:oligoendopeptidase F n=1 Tax=Ammoniphilus sp. CFH 90114 TaxID=2493665 RepID=UPI0013E90E3D|nr:oligoendopeptidase F [Ammoniphilus sp. CFH 90114]
MGKGSRQPIFILLLAFVIVFASVANGLAQEVEGEAKIPQYKTRKEVPAQYKWNLEDLYVSVEAWEKDLREVEELSDELSKYNGRLGNSLKNLRKAMEKYVQLSRSFEKTYTYAKLSFHTNKSDSVYQALSSRADDVAIKMSEKISFFIPELINIPEKKLMEYLSDPSMKEYKRWIELQVRVKEHTLPKELEQVLAKSGVLADAPESIFGMLTKDLTFPSIKDQSGNEITLTPANYAAFMKSPDREVRKRAYEAYYKTINQFRDTFAQILQSEVKKNIFYSEVRQYPSTRDASMEGNQIPVSVYDNLIATVGKQLPSLHRYIELKKEAANLDKMYLYDLYVKFGEDRERSYIPYAKAQERIKSGLQVLGQDYARLLDRSFKDRWIDVYYTPGKRSGAFQWGGYDSHPYILMNYQGEMDDIYTLAHELGHAAHSHFSNRTQSYLNASYPIFTAEVASTTNEALLFREMYQKAKTKEEKIAILNQRLEDYSGTLFLQTMFAEFEKAIHEKSEKGEALTSEILIELYGSLMKKYFGDSLEIDLGASLGWARIPHFYRNYYVYQYATGFAAANAFAQQMWDEGEPAVERYIEKFLSAGNSKDPIEVLKEAGVDMTSPEVIETALKGFIDTLDEMERLLKE